MAIDLVQHLRARATKGKTELITCSLCLRVRRGSNWSEAEDVIRELRSYELEAPPRLRSAVCEDCADSIFSRRRHEESEVQAA